jgi:hypothetical protein
MNEVPFISQQFVLLARNVVMETGYRSTKEYVIQPFPRISAKEHLAKSV